MSRKASRRTPVVPAEKEEASADSDASDEESNDGRSVVSSSHSSCSDKSMSDVASDSEESVEAADDFEYDVLKVLDEKTVDGIQSFYVKWKDGPGPVKAGTPKGQPNWHEWSLDIHDTWTEDAHKYMDLVTEFRERRVKELEETSKKMERSAPIAPKPSEKERTSKQTTKRVESRERQAVKTKDDDSKERRSLRSSSKTGEKRARGSQQPAEKEQTPKENPKRGDISTYFRRSGRVKNNETTESHNEMPSTSADIPTTSTSVSPLNIVTLLDVKQEPGMEQEKTKKKKEKEPVSAMTMDWKKVQQSSEDKEMHKKRTKFASAKDKKKNATGTYPRQKPQTNNSDDSEDYDDSGDSDWDAVNQAPQASIPDPTEPVRPPTDLGALFQNVKMEETGSPSKSNSNLYLNISKENDEVGGAQVNLAENNPDAEVDSENDEDADYESNSSSDDESDSDEEEGDHTIICVPQDESGYAQGYTGRIVGHKTIQGNGAEEPTTLLRVVFRALACSHWLKWDHVKAADELGFRDYLKLLNEKEERKKNKELAKIYDEKHAAYLARITAETAALNLEEAQAVV